MMSMNTIATGLLATFFLAAPSMAATLQSRQMDCTSTTGGAGTDAVTAVQDHFIATYVQGEVCPPGQDQVSGDTPGEWCGECEGALLIFRNGGAEGSDRCFTDDDVRSALSGASGDGTNCVYEIEMDPYLQILISTPEDTTTDLECVPC